MKIITVLGTRPEIIRLCLVIARLDGLCEHRLVHTEQNFDRRLSEVFFEDLGVRAPDFRLQVKGPFGQQVGQILARIEPILEAERPDRLLVLGDTNSSLCALVAKRMGIAVVHMEAGNRCFDDRVPEELNRRLIDHASDLLLPYTERSRANLLREGIPSDRVFVTGNPIREVLDHFAAQVDASPILERHGLERGAYMLVTLHRAENVDLESRLRSIAGGLADVQKAYGVPMLVSTHPRTRARLEQFGVTAGDGDIRLLEPFSFFDFVRLERHARCVLTDSGTVQEECAIFGVPVVTLRDVTERPETIECGSNILSGGEPDTIGRCVRIALANAARHTAPAEYQRTDVSDTVINLVLGYTDTAAR